MLQDGLTALHDAAARDYPEVIDLLVKHGAAVDIRNKVSEVWDDLHCDTNHVRIN